MEELEVQEQMAKSKFEQNQRHCQVELSPIAEKGLFARRKLPAGHEIEYFGEFFDSTTAIKEAGQDDSAYLIGNGNGDDDEQVIVNGIAIPEQHAIYANHQPEKYANCRLFWDKDRYQGRSNIGQPVLITKRQIQTGEELTADYGPHYAYEKHGMVRSQRYLGPAQGKSNEAIDDNDPFMCIAIEQLDQRDVRHANYVAQTVTQSYESYELAGSSWTWYIRRRSSSQSWTGNRHF
jgi:hypothetical protein